MLEPGGSHAFQAETLGTRGQPGGNIMMNVVRCAAFGAMAFAAATGTALAQSNLNFTLVNNSGFVVVHLNVSPSTEINWGPDILGREVLANTESAEISFTPETDICLWDLRVTYEDKDQNEMSGVNLCEVGEVNLTPAQEESDG
jgi:hypothetical protein